LQEENHSRWLKSVSGIRSTDGKTDKALVRKRKRALSPQSPIADPPNQPAKTEMTTTPAPPAEPAYSRKPETAHRSQPIDKPAPGKPWKMAADGTEPFNRKKKGVRLCAEALRDVL
jgi:hypothetical protein